MDTVHPTAVQATRWPWQCLQGDQWIVPTLPQLRSAGAKTLVVYADPIVYNPSEPQGIRTALDPGEVDPLWVLVDSTGAQVTRANNGGEYLLDISNPDYQAKSAAFLIAKCRVQGWDGVMLDEVNESLSWSGFTSTPVRNGTPLTDADWQAAQLSYATAVASLLQYAGYRCYINYGGSYDQWAKTLLAQVDGACSQYWIGTSGSSTPTASLPNGQWLSDVAWAQYCEQQAKQSTFHCSTADPAVATYALASYLLVSSGKGVFAAAVNDVLDDLYPAAFADALKLGNPLGPYATHAGIYTRQYQHGLVTVEPTAMTGSITITS